MWGARLCCVTDGVRRYSVVWRVILESSNAIWRVRETCVGPLFYLRNIVVTFCRLINRINIPTHRTRGGLAAGSDKRHLPDKVRTLYLAGTLIINERTYM
jgi:hypothetical protein